MRLAGGGRISVIVFDLDGTLIESDDVKTRAYFDIFPAEARPHVESVRAADRYASRFQIIGRVLERWRGAPAEPAEVERLAKAYNDICEPHQRTCPERPGARRVLETLSSAFPLYLCSGTLESSLTAVVTGRGWDAFFRGVYGGPGKKRGNLERAASHSGKPFAEFLVVGDTRDDLEAARATGCRFLGVASGSTDFDTTAVDMLGDLRQLEDLAR